MLYYESRSGDNSAATPVDPRVCTYLTLVLSLLLLLWEGLELLLSFFSSEALLLQQGSSDDDEGGASGGGGGAMTLRSRLCAMIGTCGRLRQRAWTTCLHAFDRTGHVLLLSNACAVAACVLTLGWQEWPASGSYYANTHGLEPLSPAETRRDAIVVQSLLSVATLFAWLSLMAEAYKPYELASTFFNIVRQTLLTDCLKFLLIFIPLLCAFATAINSLLRGYPAWATRWGSWWLTAENLLLLSFLGHPPDIGDEGVYPSSIWVRFQGRGLASNDFDRDYLYGFVPSFIFYLLFMLYALVQVIMLINLLIAMEGQRDSNLHFQLVAAACESDGLQALGADGRAFETDPGRCRRATTPSSSRPRSPTVSSLGAQSSPRVPNPAIAPHPATGLRRRSRMPTRP